MRATLSVNHRREGGNTRGAGFVVAGQRADREIAEDSLRYNGAFESVDTAMQDIVDILREREVSWATIGHALHVSRQAAWKRFG